MIAHGQGTLRVGEAYRAVYRRRGLEEPDWLVDSSKDPYRLAWLVHSGLFDLRAIHLVRDPRGFVCSELGNAEPSSDRRAPRALRKSVVWVVQNELVRRACNLLAPGNWCLVRYEDLASEPATTIEHVGRRLGLPVDRETLSQFWDRADSHAIGGNPMRHRRQAVGLDERWRRELSEGEQRLIWMATAPWRRMYGYR